MTPPPHPLPVLPPQPGGGGPFKRMTVGPRCYGDSGIHFSSCSMSSKSGSIGGFRAKEAMRVSETERLPPRANDEALAFLASIQPEELKLLCYSETLAMVCEGGGELSLQAQPGIYQDGQGATQSCILVQATCHSHVDNTPCETSLLGYISWNLEILEQQYHEVIKRGREATQRQKEKKKPTAMSRDPQNSPRGHSGHPPAAAPGPPSGPSHHLQKTGGAAGGDLDPQGGGGGWPLPLGSSPSIQELEGQGGGNPGLPLTRVLPRQELQTKLSSHPLASVSGLVSEAANLLLLRVMGRRQAVPEGGRFLAFDTTGQLCHATYHMLGSQPLKIGQEQVPTFGVEQTIHSEDDIPITFQFYLLTDGHLARRIQVGSPASCIISRMPALQEEEEEEPQHPVPASLGQQPLEWEEDLQLYSMFLDRKEELEAGHATYLRRHPEVQSLLSDFLLFLLLHQPSDVATFAAQFFGPFARDLPQPPAFHSSLQPGPFRPPGPIPTLTFRPGAERPNLAGNEEGEAGGGPGTRPE
uniref:Ciliogenesis-associated TTC17-interacting protein n=1 Tax=Ornithorhynchus anatinus TaxID=9258 RepID=A0A6I8NVY6_ORNAN